MPILGPSCHPRPSGAMDSALDFESRGCGFESHLGLSEDLCILHIPAGYIFCIFRRRRQSLGKTLEYIAMNEALVDIM